MFQNYLSVALRNLVKHKLYSAINIIGLAVGLAACVLITLFVRDEFSYDKMWANAGNIYRLGSTFAVPGREPFVTAAAQGPAKEALKTFFPEEVEHSTRFNSMGTVLRYKNGVFSQRIQWTDPETADIFDFDVIAGDMHQALSDNASLAVSESFARKYFGDEDPMGKVVTLNIYTIERDYRVAAVFRDLPHNTVLSFEAMAMIDEKDFTDFPYEFAEWFSINNFLYFTLKPGARIETINERLVDFTDTNISIPPVFTGGQQIDASSIISYQTQSIKDVQLHPMAPGGEMKPTGTIANVVIFASIAGLILLIACINFMNLATAKSTQRAREVALRKVLGASRSQLVLQFLGESVLLALIGLMLGIVLVEVTLPSFGAFVGKELAFAYSDPLLLSILLGLVLVVGGLGGVYPALVLSGFLPARVLKANKSAETSGSAALRNALVVVQFTISIALIVATGVVYGQKLYATNMDVGFNKDNLLLIRNVGRAGVRDKQDALREEVLRLPGVVKAAYSSDGPASGNESNDSVTIPGSDTQQTILIGIHNIDYDFLDTYQIPLLAGRNYSRDRATDVQPDEKNAKDGEILQGSIIINEGALRRLGFGTPQEAIGRVIQSGIGGNNDNPVFAHFTVIGVIPDMHFQSLRAKMRPEMYYLAPDSYRTLSVRFTGDPQKLIGQIEASWKSLTGAVPFEYDYVDQVMAEEFEEEQSQSILLGIFSGLAVIIACLGLYGLASFTAERRTKEIGIRKVMGASVFDVVRLLIWQFSKPVLIANLIAWPLAGWGLMSWLENFPYRMDTWLIAPFCIGAGLIALMIAWITVGGNAAKVARANPIDALRYE